MTNIINELKLACWEINKTNIASLLLCLISSFNLEFEVTNERQFEKQNKVFLKIQSASIMHVIQYNVHKLTQNMEEKKSYLLWLTDSNRD